MVPARSWQPTKAIGGSFFCGLAKTERENVSAEELKALQKLAANYLGHSAADLNALVEEGALEEICHDPETESEKPDS